MDYKGSPSPPYICIVNENLESQNATKMKTKILIIALANAMLSFGNLSHAQEIKPLSAKNKTITVENVSYSSIQPVEQTNENPGLTVNMDNQPIATDDQLHSKIVIHMQQFVEDQAQEKNLCSELQQRCDEDYTFVIPSIVY